MTHNIQDIEEENAKLRAAVYTLSKERDRLQAGWYQSDKELASRYTAEEIEGWIEEWLQIPRIGSLPTFIRTKLRSRQCSPASPEPKWDTDSEAWSHSYPASPEGSSAGGEGQRLRAKLKAKAKCELCGGTRRVATFIMRVGKLYPAGIAQCPECISPSPASGTDSWWLRKIESLGLIFSEEDRSPGSLEVGLIQTPIGKVLTSDGALVDDPRMPTASGMEGAYKVQYADDSILVLGPSGKVLVSYRRTFEHDARVLCGRLNAAYLAGQRARTGKGARVSSCDRCRGTRTIEVHDSYATQPCPDCAVEGAKP